MQKVTLYTDGCCIKNPGKGGWGFYCVFQPLDGENTPILSFSSYGGKKKTTNNEMELTAMCKGLSFIPVGREITMIVDTQYGLKGLLNSSNGSQEYLNGYLQKNLLGNDIRITGWIASWSQRGWRTASGSPVANKDLWIDLLNICKKHILGGSTIHLIWAKGHSGVRGNEIADSLANLGPSLFS